MGMFLKCFIEQRNLETGKWELKTEQTEEILRDLINGEDSFLRSESVQRNYPLFDMLIHTGGNKTCVPFKYSHGVVPDDITQPVAIYLEDEFCKGSYTLKEVRRFNWERKYWHGSALRLQTFLNEGWTSGTWHKTEHLPSFLIKEKFVYVGVREAIRIYQSLTVEQIREIATTPIDQLETTVIVKGNEVRVRNLFVRTFWYQTYRDLGYDDFKDVITKMESLTKTPSGNDVRIILAIV